MKKQTRNKTLEPGKTLIIALALACFALRPAPNAFGVVPPPDGGYPGFNTAEGQNALFSLNTSTGLANTAVGSFSLWSNVNASSNTAVGVGTLLFNTAGENTAVGAAALLFNATGEQNTATGVRALFSNTTGSENVAAGYQALANNTDGDANVAIGNGALFGNTAGFDNSAFGALALASNTVGTDNTAVGVVALKNNIGGFGNVAVGAAALFDNVSGELNVAIGDNAGRNLTGNDNVCIGSLVQGVAGESNTTRIKNIYSSVASGRAVFVDSDNKLGTLLSTGRVKDDIKPMDSASEAILALKPVTFRYKKEVERSRAIQFGLIAEEVAEVSANLVILDATGEPESVRYEAINAMLLNEFLKQHKAFLDEHRSVQEQGAAIADLKKEIETLTTTVKEQAAQIQKVSTQIELNRPVAQRVALRSP